MLTDVFFNRQLDSQAKHFGNQEKKVMSFTKELALNWCSHDGQQLFFSFLTRQVNSFQRILVVQKIKKLWPE